MKTKLLSLLLVLSLIFNINCLETNAVSTKTFTEENIAVINVDEETAENIDIPEEISWNEVKLWNNVYDDMTYERWWQGAPEAPKIKLPEKPKKVNLGKFKITYYCPCYECSEGHGHNTATGKRATEGRTIAVDKRVIPYGTKVMINGHTYIAEDCGGAIKQKVIDIFLESHAETERRGVDYYNVYILRE